MNLLELTAPGAFFEADAAWIVMATVKNRKRAMRAFMVTQRHLIHFTALTLSNETNNN
jgi:hypothetical protein